MKLEVSSGKHIDLLSNTSHSMFKENNQFVIAVLGATKVMIFVAVVLETRKGMKHCVSVLGCREKCQTEGDPKTSRVKGI